MVKTIGGYPRPQMVREGHLMLDGKWGFAFDDADIGERSQWYTKQSSDQEILVPFTYETSESGIADTEYHSIVWYWKKIELSGWYRPDTHLILHFEGCDYQTKVWVNGRLIGEHSGGYSRFSFDLGEHSETEVLNICVRVSDSLSEEQMRGKQRWLKDSYGCWYVQTTGIWKSVWAEMVPESYISNLKMTPDIAGHKLELELSVSGIQNRIEAECTVSYQGKRINSIRSMVREGKLEIGIDVYDKTVNEWGIALWAPQHPSLYDLDIKLYVNGELMDHVSSYFGMREIRIKGNNILLNGEPLYQRLILDQGYWKESGLTPKGDEALLLDIERVISLGYNGVRKHQKTENERFLYWCDVKGLLVWEEAPSFYKYSSEAVAGFCTQWLEIVEQNYNHPSIIVWTPLNESWGMMEIGRDKKQQSFSQMVYHLTKCVDSMRPVIVNDGWEHTISDIITLHDYEEDGERMFEKYMQYKDSVLSGEFYHNNYRNAFAEGFSYQGQPVMISEFGGIAFEQEGTQGWGYGNKVKSADEFIERFQKVTLSVKKLPYVCGYCYTQLTDVQQEINGLLTEERKFKVEPEKIREINEARAGIFFNEKCH
ncbi:glycoside hydrolase family 2 [Faecalicatena sp. AGMB00832]|uniref:Glycoside hydrolase family 2 n=1 Tax=Faecalicatena faecalis TaxID=2726362 RepID=A0ABS6D4M7_9FIRM|nr:sugar-binding domain-containing protein [Faecalicatena faecalis]MBU3876131.1 glycoside hydrolase family 2 [Faecalicatena faecalis]